MGGGGGLEEVYNSFSFLILALDGGEWATHHTSATLTAGTRWIGCLGKS
jgi:hypothetical protein